VSTLAFSQDCRSTEDFDKTEIEALDSLFPSAVNIDSAISVFAGREAEFFNSWKFFLTDFGKHLDAHGFKWEKPTRCFNRVYFNKDGTINTFLYSFKGDDLTAEQKETFSSLLNEFAKGYKLKLERNAKSNFSQCGPAMYRQQ
jgi:hypothetical protein